MIFTSIHFTKLSMKKFITTISVLFFLLFYLYGAYYHSYKSGYISLNAYDANIALAHGTKPFIIVMSIISFVFCFTNMANDS